MSKLLVARFSLGTTQLVAVVAGLLTIASVLCLMLAPEISEWDARVQVKQFERAFGFTSGTVLVPDGNGGQFEVWGIVAVAVDGAFARAGVRGGDIPFGHHGFGAERVLYALIRATKGEPGQFEVVNAADWMTTSNAFRAVEILE